MTRLNVPIRLRFLRIPATWDIRTIRRGKREHRLAFSRVQDDGSLEAFKISELDPWRCRADFFELREHDDEELLKFLTRMGVWLNQEGELLSHWSEEVLQHCRAGHPVPIDITGLWMFRAGLKQALVDKNAFKKTYAPLLLRPESGLQLVQQRGVEFPLRFEITDVASGVVTVMDAYHMLLATVFFDVASGVRFKVCEREDCQTPFPLESKHDRKFCCWYCAHITTVRRNRPPNRPGRSAKRETAKNTRKPML